MSKNSVNNMKIDAPTSKLPVSVDTPEPLRETVLDFTPDEIKLYENLKLEIEHQASNIREAIFEIGKRLFYIKWHKLYKIEGYTSISALAADKWGLNRKKCSNYIGFCECFGDIDEKTGSCNGLRPEYQDTGVSKLEALLPVARKHPDQLSKFSLQMSYGKIRAQKQELNKEEEANTNVTEEAATEPPVSVCSPDSPASEVKKPTPPAKRVLRKSRKIMELKSLEEISPENSELIQKIKEFRQRHPDQEYHFSINIIYKEEESDERD